MHVRECPMRPLTLPFAKESLFKTRRFDLPLIGTLSHQLITSVLAFAFYAARRPRVARRRIVDLGVAPTAADDTYAFDG